MNKTNYNNYTIFGDHAHPDHVIDDDHQLFCSASLLTDAKRAAKKGLGASPAQPAPLRKIHIFVKVIDGGFSEGNDKVNQLWQKLAVTTNSSRSAGQAASPLCTNTSSPRKQLTVLRRQLIYNAGIHTVCVCDANVTCACRV